MIHYIGIDNGVSGSIAILNEQGDLKLYLPTPVFKSLDYTKAKKYLNRLDVDEFMKIIKPYKEDARIFLERPMVNPMRWTASVSAIRCDEATRILLEGLHIRFQYVDSKEWQSVMLPSRKPIPKLPKDSFPAAKKLNKTRKAAFAAETKRLSKEVGKRLFPGADIKKDADALLMAEWARKLAL